MSIRRKMFLVVICTMLLLLGLHYVSSNFFILKGFSNVEHDYAEQNISRVREAIYQTANDLAIKSADWAKWDDSYNFMTHYSDEFVQSNLTPETMSDLELNIIFFIDTQGNLVFGLEKDSISDSVQCITKDHFHTLIPTNSLLHSHFSSDTIKWGIYCIKNSITYLVARPILKSNGNGPVAGTLIFVRFLNSQELMRLSRLTHLQIEYGLFNSENPSGELLAAKNALTPETKQYIQATGKTLLKGYFQIPDIFDSPLMLVKVTMDRKIFHQGQTTQIYLILFTLVSTLIFGLITILLLDKSVIVPLRKLGSDVTAIGQNSDHSQRVRVSGKNELGILSMSINAMLESLNSIENSLRSRNSKMRLVMDTLPSGLLCIDEQYIIKPEYSSAVESILGQDDLIGKSLPDILFPHPESEKEKDKLKEYLCVYFQELFPEKELKSLNPFEVLKISTKKGSTWIKLEYHLMSSENTGEKNILVDLQNISESKQLEDRIQSSEEQNTQLKIILEDPDLFKYFLYEISQVIEEAVIILNNTHWNQTPDTSLQELFRHVHTIKGTASSFGLKTVSKTAGNFESQYSEFKNGLMSHIDFTEQSRLLLGDIAKEVLDATINFRNIVGSDSFDTVDLFFRIPLSKLNALHQLTINALRSSPENYPNSSIEIDSEFNKLREVPAKRGFAKSLKTIQELLNRHTKEITFNFEGMDTPIDYETAYILNTALIHLVRNAFDHGIEFPEERQRINKTRNGSICVRVIVDETSITLTIEDDGRGIDPQKILTTAIERKIISIEDAAILTEQEIIALIFKSGFTTTESVNDISGRGIGMDAVLETVNKLRAQIFIESTVNVGTTFKIVVPKKVHI